MGNGFIELLVLDTFLLGIPILLYFFPPKEINPIYGYRTSRASASQSNWDFAQHYFAKWWIVIAVLTVCSQGVLIAFGFTISGDPPIVPLFSLAEFLVGTFVVVYATEQALKNRV